MREPAEWLPRLYEDEVAKRVPAGEAAEATWSSVMAAMVPVPVSSASRPVASSPARSKSATMIKLASSEEPPWLIKGRVTPVSGIRRVMPPTIKNA